MRLVVENAKQAIRELVTAGLWKGPVPDVILHSKSQEEIMAIPQNHPAHGKGPRLCMKTYDVTWAVNGGVKIKARSADEAMLKVQAMTLDELLLIEHVEFNGPDATEASEAEE